MSTIHAQFVMKFKFCSDGDCPLWALAGLHALSTLPAQVFRNLVHHIVEEQPEDGILDLLKDTGLSSRGECARAAGVVRWTLRAAWRSACPGALLARDLLVLGVPRAHAAALADAADAGREGYVANVKKHGFMVNKVTDAKVSPGPEGTVDSLKLTLYTDDVFTGEQNSRELLIDNFQAKVLLEELKTAYKKMEELDSSAI